MVITEITPIPSPLRLLEGSTKKPWQVWAGIQNKWAAPLAMPINNPALILDQPRSVGAVSRRAVSDDTLACIAAPLSAVGCTGPSAHCCYTNREQLGGDIHTPSLCPFDALRKVRNWAAAHRSQAQRQIAAS